MNFRVLAASAQAPQRSNGNDFLPHNAPRLEKGGVKEGGGTFKGRWGCCRSARGLLLFEGCTLVSYAFHLLTLLIISAGEWCPGLPLHDRGWAVIEHRYIPAITSGRNSWLQIINALITYANSTLLW